ncbi:MAG: metal-dependent transcriptional regulator [Deltaproteobacteria bacterium]|nr:metal-dependent transcriptional regulator [Deltaproteobacteria bacterium]
MRRTDDEILEAIWVVAERGGATLQAVVKRCPEKVNQSDIAVLEEESLLRVDGSELILTPTGRHRARRLVRCHRLAESLLYMVFDLDWTERERIACEVEHTLVPELADGICTLLGHPTECPDGKEIPPGVCCVAHWQSVSSRVIPLSELPPGSRARILFVKPAATDRLRRLTEVGLNPGVLLTLQQRTPSYSVRYEGTDLALDSGVAADIFVSPISGDANGDEIADQTMESRASFLGKIRESFKTRQSFF